METSTCGGWCLMCRFAFYKYVHFYFAIVGALLRTSCWFLVRPSFPIFFFPLVIRRAFGPSPPLFAVPLSKQLFHSRTPTHPACMSSFVSVPPNPCSTSSRDPCPSSMLGLCLVGLRTVFPPLYFSCSSPAVHTIPARDMPLPDSSTDVCADLRL